MVVKKTPESKKYVAWFRREEGDVWHIGDLWRAHPDPKKAGHTWQFAGRTDDLISYKSGLRLHPVHYELKHSEHDLIRTAIMSGNRHRQPVLLIELNEPKNDQPAQQQILDQIWKESVMSVNQEAPACGRIARTHILISTPDKLFERNVKGTVVRNATIRKFEREIEVIYAKFRDETLHIEGRGMDD